MTFLSNLQLFYSRKIREALRNPAFVMMTLTIPLLYLLLFAPMLKRFTGMAEFGSTNVLNFFLPGMIVVLAVFGGLFVGFGMIDEIRQGVIERFRVTPASRLALLFGAVLRDVTSVMVQAIIIIAVAIPFGLKVNIPGLLLIFPLIAMLTAIFSAFSYALALIFKSEDALAPITQGISMPITLLAGFLLPMSLAPGWLQVAAHFNPVYYAIEASRTLMSDHIDAQVVMEAYAFLIPLLGLVSWWAIRKFKTVIS
ncbi:ABC-2 type transport system permease protein [Chitinophaga dinghuensis]|uniref:Transport permease protein n=1 Tax=Chitinophaga dinghuensis TaxID=1539050 RepID=A0A327W2T4_9BACT|nr:ABC transporter permease [Chitinophaga dinghuensis]RAJ79268.1 ABC-2 type transport system permease protein [Chitinophaga dinghuensis]